ncbi:MAG: cytochrome P450 [Rhizobiaceae bacterium]
MRPTAVVAARTIDGQGQSEQHRIMMLPVFSQPPTDPEFFNNPYPVYDEMRRLGPAFHWAEYDLRCFASHQSVDAALRDRRFGRDVSHIMSREEAGLAPIPDRLKPFYGFESHSMLEREPPAHTRLRALVNRAFVSRHIERLRPRIEALAHALVDGFEKNGRVDLLPAYAEKIPVIVIAELLGVPAGMADQLLAWSHDMVAMYQFNRDRQTEDRAVEATEAFGDFMRGYVEKRRASPADDLITRLIQAESAGDRLSNDELVTTCILLLNAGHEATVHGIGNAVKALLETGSDVQHLFAEDGAGIGATDECLRYDAPLHLFTRFAMEDFEFCGISLRKGMRVGLMLGAANRDPARYANPDRLDFVRGGANHVSFGAGIHFCVGAPLARLEMAVAIPVLFQRLSGLRLAGRPLYADRFHFHGLQSLELEWG